MLRENFCGVVCLGEAPPSVEISHFRELTNCFFVGAAYVARDAHREQSSFWGNWRASLRLPFDGTGVGWPQYHR